MMNDILRKNRFAKIKIALLASLIIALGGKWYSYVAYADTPFDSFGAGINALMPGPIKQYGCDRLKERFGNIPIPPEGCGVDGRWL